MATATTVTRRYVPHYDGISHENISDMLHEIGIEALARHPAYQRLNGRIQVLAEADDAGMDLLAVLDAALEVGAAVSRIYSGDHGGKSTPRQFSTREREQLLARMVRQSGIEQVPGRLEADGKFSMELAVTRS